MRILKFGGTSVGKPERMEQVFDLINNEQKKIVVLSALSGTTNSLVEIAACYRDNQKEKAGELVAQLENHYLSFIGELYATEAVREKAKRHMEAHFSLLGQFKSATFMQSDEKIILAQGELMSTHLFHFFCEERGLNSQLLPALEFMRTENGEPDSKFIKRTLSKLLKSYPDTPIFITQGYICKNEFGQIDNLRRGGSDYSASLIGAACQADEIQIWTDIDGLHNNDPRFVKPTFPVHKLSFAEAAELAYFGAKIMHPSSVLPAQKANIPVKLLNTMEPQAKGTIISSETDQTLNRVKAVAAKDGITAIKIRSLRMLYAYGFLKKIFEVFERYRTPIDMITTSEVAVSLTIDDKTNLPSILHELKKYAIVDVDEDQTIVCIVGSFGHDEAGMALKVLQCLKNIPLRMISSGGSQSNISLLVKSEFKITVLQALNQGLFDMNIVREKLKADI